MVERKPLARVVVPDGETPSIGEFQKKGVHPYIKKIEKKLGQKKHVQEDGTWFSSFDGT